MKLRSRHWQWSRRIAVRRDLHAIFSKNCVGTSYPGTVRLMQCGPVVLGSKLLALPMRGSEGLTREVIHMRNQLIGLALAVALTQAPSLQGQLHPAILNHNSVAAVTRVLANGETLRLTPAQVVTLTELRSRFTREQTRLVRVGWRGAPGKVAVPQYQRVQVAPRPDHYALVTVRTSIAGFDRVPGKAVARVSRVQVISLVQRPCPFIFLASEQIAKVHDLLTQM